MLLMNCKCFIHIFVIIEETLTIFRKIKIFNEAVWKINKLHVNRVENFINLRSKGPRNVHVKDCRELMLQ